MKSTFLILLMLLAIYYRILATPSLAPREVTYFEEQAQQTLLDYYASLNLIVGSQLSYNDKESTVITLMDDYRSESVVVYNDYQDGGISTMKIKEYLDQLNVSYGNEKLSASFPPPIVNIKGVYVAGDSFFIKAEVNRSIVCSDISKNNTKTVDYYLSFYPDNKDIKIYSMTEHTDNTANLTPAPVENKTALNATNNSASNETTNPAYVLTNITPSNFTLMIDGTTKYCINGIPAQVPTGVKRIEISAPGYQTKIIEAYNVKEGENKLSVMLDAKIGTITITNAREQEKGAQVFLDGKPIGTVPIDRYPVQEGLHSIQVSKDGYYSKKKNVKIIAQKDDKPWEVRLINKENVKKGIGTAAVQILRMF